MIGQLSNLGEILVLRTLIKQPPIQYGLYIEVALIRHPSRPTTKLYSNTLVIDYYSPFTQSIV